MKQTYDLLIEKQDKKYGEFQRKLLPNIDGASVIGVRTPDLRQLAKVVAGESWCNEFLAELPHKYYEENQLHFFIISEYKDFEKCISAVEEFLPYVDNWAVCDQSVPKVFKKHKKELILHVEKWLCSDKAYTVRYGIGTLMRFYLDEDFSAEYLKKAASLCRSDENYDSYYINMMIAWYFATALAKQWDETVVFIKNKVLMPWVHNKAIQKARESFRVSDEHKEFLNTLKV